MIKRLSVIVLLAAVLSAAKTYAQDLPAYYEGYIGDKVQSLESLRKSQRDGFIFWTDTHTQRNTRNAPALINYVLQGDSSPKVVWGGDSLPAFTDDIAKYWSIQEKMLSEIKADVYNVRGNHDLVCKTSPKENTGDSYSQEKTAYILASAMTGKVVRNKADKGACYYYFDNPASKMRYVVFDTTDSVRETGKPNQNDYGVGDVQLNWILKNAIGKAPEGYDFVIFMHVPVVLNEVYNPKYWRLISEIEKLGETGRLKAVISGHCHQDTQVYRNGVLWITTASDAHYQDIRRGPFAKKNEERKSGTVGEQAFDYVSLGENQITMVRIGSGPDRTFNQPSTLLTGKSLRLKTMLGKGCTWRVVDMEGRANVKGPDGKRHWEYKSEKASIAPNGEVTGLIAGEVIALAMSADSSKIEFFPIDVRQNKAAIPGKAVFFGNALLLANGEYGMNASTPESDWYAIVTRVARQYNPEFAAKRFKLSKFENLEDESLTAQTIEEVFLNQLAGDEDLICIQLDYPKDISIFAKSMPALAASLKKKCPGARLVHMGSWYHTDEEYQALVDIVKSCGIQHVSIRGIRSKDTESTVGAVSYFKNHRERTLKGVESVKEHCPDSPRTNIIVKFVASGKTVTASIMCDSYSLDGDVLTYKSDQQICKSRAVATHPNDEGFRKIAQRFIDQVYYNKK